MVCCALQGGSVAGGEDDASLSLVKLTLSWHSCAQPTTNIYSLRDCTLNSYAKKNSPSQQFLTVHTISHMS